MVSNSASLDVQGVHYGYFYTSSDIAFSLSHLLCAVCDVGFGDNKWLDVFQCHVKPGKGHVPHYDYWGVWRSKVWVLGAHSPSGGIRLQKNRHSARSASLSVEKELHLKHLLLKVDMDLFIPRMVKAMGERSAGDAMAIFLGPCCAIKYN